MVFAWIMNRLSRAGLVAIALVASGCSGSDSTSGAEGGGGAEPSSHAIHVTIALSEDAEGIPIGAQNGSLEHVPRSEVIGKPVIWATTNAGEVPGNTLPLDYGTTEISDDLGASFATGSDYDDGAYEVSCYISISGDAAPQGPQAGDLASFTLDPPLAGEPPTTGVSVRVRIDGADATLTLVNDHFVRY